MHRKEDGSRRASGSDAPGARPSSPIEADESTSPAPEPFTPATSRADDGEAIAEEVDLELSRDRPRAVSDIGDAEVIDVQRPRPIDPSEDDRAGDDRGDQGGGDERDGDEMGDAFGDDEAQHLRATDPDRPAVRPPPLPPVSQPHPQETFPPVSLADPRLGETLNGRYRLEKLIGKGGMGRVYRAIQFPLNRSVAIKILNPEFQRKDPQFVKRFYLEAATAARLTHPNTITVFDYGEAESGELFIVMEYLRGRALSRVITNEGPFAAERTLHIAIQICRALREAHSKGIIHRDLKPGNILLLEEGDDSDFVKVLDFGLVKLFTPPGQGGQAVNESQEPLTPGVHVEPELTRAGMFLGSPKYMSPEQIQGTPLDPRTDIYSLGVLMFQMMAGKPPFGGSTSVEVIYKHVNQPVPRIAEVTPGLTVPDELESIIRQCLSKSRDDRFASMAELLVRLKDAKRLITGISTASEIGISLAQLGPHAPNVAVSNPSVSAASPSTSGSHSFRPRTRPSSSSQSQSISLSVSRASVSGSQPSSSSPPPGSNPGVGTSTSQSISISQASISQASRSGKIDNSKAKMTQPEAAFVEIEDDTPSSMVRGPAKPAKTNKLARVAPVVAGSALVLVLGVAAYVLSSSPNIPPLGPGSGASSEVRGGAAVPAEVRVSFVSTPEGAEVFDEDGTSLGVAPLAKTFPIGGPDQKPHRFVFKLEGFMDEVIEEPLETASLKIHARMRAVPAGETPRKAKPGDTDYKENPY